MAAAAPADWLDAGLQAIGGAPNLPARVDPPEVRRATPDEDALLRQFEQPQTPDRPATAGEHAVLAPLERSAAGQAAADPNRRATPDEHALLTQFERTEPAPLIHHVAAPEPLPEAIQNPKSTIQNPEAAHVQFDPQTGAVQDPVSGLPMHRGEAVAERPVPFSEAAVNAAVPVLQGLKTVVDLPFRVLGFLANPVHGALQVGFEHAGQAVGAQPGASDPEAFLNGLRGFFQGVTSPEAGRAAWDAFISRDIKISTPFSVPGIAERPLMGITPGSVTDQWVRGLGNFAFNMLVDELTGKVQGPMVGALLKVANRAGELSGLHDWAIPLPGGAKSLNTIKVENAGRRVIAQVMAKHEGLQGPIQEAAIKAVNAADKAYQRLDKLGVPLKGKNAAGRPINTLDDYVYHWIEAGTDGAAYKTRAEVEQEAAKLATDPKTKAAIVQSVREIGSSYSQAWQQVGLQLEKVKWLRPGTVAEMGGHYAARMYESTSHNPDDIAAWLDYAAEVSKGNPQVGLSADAYRDAEAIIGASGTRGGVANAAKARTVETFAAREARGAATQASPVFARSIRGQTRVAARAGALGEIAQDPTLARPGTLETPLPPKFTPQAYQQAQTDLAAAQQVRQTAQTAYNTAKVAGASPAAATALQTATADLAAAKAAERTAQRALEPYTGLVVGQGGTRVPQSPQEYHTAAMDAVGARQAEQAQAAATYARALKAYRKANHTPADELAFLKARDDLKDKGIAWANAQTKLAEVEEEIKTGRSGVTRTTVPTPAGAVRLVDRRYGPLDGMIVPDHVKEALDAYLNPAPVDKGFQRLVAWMARQYKGQAMFLSFPSLLHKVKYDSVLAEGAAKDAGLSFTPADVARATRDLVAFRRGGKLTKAIEALHQETRSFVPRDETLGQMGQSLTNVLGLGRPGLRDIPLKTWQVWNRAGKVVPEAIGEIERTYKIALTEKLAQKYGYPEAARRAAATIGDWTMTDPTIRTLEKYGGVPFLTARAKAFPKMLNIAAKHPEVLMRWGHPYLGGSFSAAMGPGVRTQATIAPVGAVPVPGVQDENGRQQFVTRDPTRVEPFADLWGLGAGVGGVPVLAATALANTDIGRSFRNQAATPIVKPGELPPADEDAARFNYVAQHLQPGIWHGAMRVVRASEGRTKFGGPYAEPESVGKAMLGTLTGVDLGTPKTEGQRAQDALKNMTQAGRAMGWAAGYLGELSGGSAKPRDFPLAERGIRTVADAKERIQTARKRLKDIADGRQFSGTQQIEELRKQADWLFTLHQIAVKRQQEEVSRQASLR